MLPIGLSEQLSRDYGKRQRKPVAGDEDHVGKDMIVCGISLLSLCTYYLEYLVYTALAFSGVIPITIGCLQSAREVVQLAVAAAVDLEFTTVAVLADGRGRLGVFDRFERQFVGTRQGLVSHL